jgi:alpha-glucosidase (family GH31 glycosyl hydrolase)
MRRFLFLLFLMIFISCGEEKNASDNDTVYPDEDAVDKENDDDSREVIKIPDIESAELKEPSGFAGDVEIYDFLKNGFFLHNFKLKYEKNPLSITVTHIDDPGRVIFSTIKGFPFLNAKLTSTSYKENAGSFTIAETVLKMCVDLNVNEIKYDGKVLELIGEFGDNCGVSFSVQFSARSGSRLGFEVKLTPEYPATDVNAVWRAVLVYESSFFESFYGFGEQYTVFNMKGRRLPVISQEQGIGRGEEPLTTVINQLNPGSSGDWHTSYAPVPHYITNTKRSLFLENYEYSVFDMTQPGSVSVEADSNILKGQIVYGDSIAQLIENYTDFCGRMDALPEWMDNGAIAGIQGGTAKVTEIIEKFKAHNVPLAGIWLQDWVGQRETLIGKRLWWNWELDAYHYPNWGELVENIHETGAKVLGYVNPFLVDVKSKKNFDRNLFAEAMQKGYLLKDHSGIVKMIGNGGFDAALVDLSNSEAVEWMKGIIKDNMLNIGIDGWMADFGEATPYDVAPASGESSSTFHNRYVELWAKLNKEVITELKKEGEIAFFNRAGFTKSPMYSTLFWLGDQIVSWDDRDGIKTAVTGLLSSGLSGYSLNHSDTGGYMSVSYPVITIKRSKELLMRWMEMNAFTALFRTHEGNNPESGGVQVYSDDELLSFFGRFANIFKELKDYRKELMLEAQNFGYPVVRHPMFHYESDAEVFKLEYQFMLGSDFMIAPVLDPGKNEIEIYLPEGEWVHLWSDLEYINETGIYVTVSAPLGKPAVFYRKGSKYGEKLKEFLKDF